MIGNGLFPILFDSLTGTYCKDPIVLDFKGIMSSVSPSYAFLQNHKDPLNDQRCYSLCGE